MSPIKGALIQTTNMKNHLAGKVVNVFLYSSFSELTRFYVIYSAFHNCRGKNQRAKMACDGSWTTEMDNQPSEPASDVGDFNDVAGSSKFGESELEAVVKKAKVRLLYLVRLISGFYLFDNV